MRLPNYRQLSFLLYCLLSIVGISTFIFSLVTTERRQQAHSPARYERLLLDTPGCKIPSYDPLDSSIKMYFDTTPKNAVCPRDNNPLFIVNFNVPFLDVTLLKERYRIPAHEVRCHYKEITRCKSLRKNDYCFGAPVRIRFASPIPKEYIYVSCSYGGVIFYNGFLLLPQLKPPQNATKQKTGDDKMNILILGVDSTSRLNFDRHLVATGRFVREKLKAFELFGYNKVGANSFPNQAPLLSGLSQAEALARSENYFFDNLHLLWDDFSSSGYVTLFMEEEPKYGLFSYSYMNGFRNSPTDYYPRFVMLAIEDMIKENMCMGHRLKTEVYMDYVLNWIKLINKRPFFAYFWLSDLTHDNVNRAALLDRPLHGFLEQLHRLGAFENTALVFLSDHGMRFGSSRETVIGRHEDVTPFAFLSLPAWFSKRYAKAAKNLAKNQMRLTTHYDVHATLKSLSALPDFDPVDTRKGRNLFLQVTEWRTCAAASIPAQFCSCLGTPHEPPEDTVSRRLVAFALDYLNLEARFNGADCYVWTLQNLTEVAVLVHRPRVLTQFRLRMVTTPHAVFEVYVTQLLGSRKYSIGKSVDFVERLDWYHDSAHCASTGPLQKFCYCVI